MSKQINYDWNFNTIVKILLVLGRVYLGGWMIASGSSYWLTQFGLHPIFPQPVGNTPLSSQMLVTMIEVGLFHVVKIAEIICGLMLIFNRMVPLGVAISLPISGVVWFNAIILNHRFDKLFDPTYMGVMCFYLSIILLFPYIRFFAPLFTWKAKMGHISDLKHVVEALKADK